MKIRYIFTLIIFFSIGLLSAQTNRIQSNYLRLNKNQLLTIGFEENNGRLSFTNTFENTKYVFNVHNTDFFVSISDKINSNDKKENTYYPVIVVNKNGKLHYTHKRKEGLYKPLLPILISQFKKQYVFYFTFTNELYQKLLDVENLEDYVIRDVKYLEDKIKEQENNKYKIK